MRRALILTWKLVLSLFISVAAVYLLLALAALTAGLTQYRKNEITQEERMARLREEFYPGYVSGGEQRFASFDLSAALADGIRLNEVSFLATHNSYQPRAAWPYRLLLRAVSLIPGVPVDGRLSGFAMDGLTEQLEHGIRSLELDVEAVETDGSLSFLVTHFLLDNRSSCQDFGTALEELKLWSEHNPSHLPLIILIEPKEIKRPLGRMRSFDADCALQLDGVIRRVMGERLLTPDEVMGGYASPAAMRADDGWPLLAYTLGRVLFVLHPCSVTEDYIGADRSLRSQAMFPCLRPDRMGEDYATFILDNNPAAAAERYAAGVRELNLMVRTRADDYPDFSDDRYAASDRSGAQIVTTDFPPRDVRQNEHTWDFDGFTVRLRG